MFSISTPNVYTFTFHTKLCSISPPNMLIYGYYSITAEKTITGGIPKSWCEYSPEVTCGLHPHHISAF